MGGKYEIIGKEYGIQKRTGQDVGSAGYRSV